MTLTPRQELLCAFAIAALLVIARSAIFIVYEQSFFESDQAIIGLMAKHLAEGRAFPLFYYGQIYMLAVDAWISAPFFLVLGPTVAALHLALTLCNVVVAWLLIVGFVRWGTLRPFLALIASSFFLFAPPLTASSLIEAGANVGPLIYVPLLWLLRGRPLWLGAVLGFGFVNREFTIYALPVLLAADALQRRLAEPGRVRFWLMAAIAAVCTWQSLQSLKPYADMMGPGTRGSLIEGAAAAQLTNISERIDIDPADLPHRAYVMVTHHLAGLFGARDVVDNVASQGHGWIFWPFVMIVAVALLRATFEGWRHASYGRAAFSFYLLGVGIVAAAVPLVTRTAESIPARYILLTLFIPIGAVGAALALEPRRLWRGVIASFVGLWLVSSASDHARQIARYAGGHEPNPKRALVEALLERNISVARSDYWRAYSTSFLSRERVKVASMDVIRISEYQRLADEAGSSLITIQQHSCPGGEPVAEWYLCRGQP